jgi:hypothetical protein
MARARRGAVLSRTQHADGSGNLVFQREYRREGRHGRFVDIGFLAVPDVREVEERIRELVHRAYPPDGGRRSRWDDGRELASDLN